MVLIAHGTVGGMPEARTASLSRGRRAARVPGGLRRLASARRRPPSGVNVVGYFGVTSGLGERARVLADALRVAGVPVSEWNVEHTMSPARHEVTDPVVRSRPVYDTTICVVTALEFPGLAQSHPDLVAVGRVIGYWFWELETVPPTHQPALAMVHEVWTPTRFVRDAYRSATDTPVRLVALPIPPPICDPTGHERLDEGGDFVFLVSFDHLSVMARKNPLGAIAAFREAFPDLDEPVRLVVKTVNADRAPDNALLLRTAAATDERIRIWDEHLTDERHIALVASADAFVSLHRSEGLGLHPAMAMSLGTPVICSAYSGTDDLMNAGSAALVPVSLVDVVDGGGAYPPGSKWGDPDLAVAASFMRRMVADPAWSAGLAARGQARMRSQLSLVDTGHGIRRVLEGTAVDGVAMFETSNSRSGVGSVATMQATHGSIGQDAPSASGSPLRRVARAATSPVRDYVNNHFEMVKDEVRRAKPVIEIDDSAAWVSVVELENSIAELSLYQTRILTRISDELEDLTGRIDDLERIVRQLAEVVGERTVQ